MLETVALAVCNNTDVFISVAKVTAESFSFLACGLKVNLLLGFWSGSVD